MGALARASFKMHEELATSLSLESYRRLTCEAVAVDESAMASASLSASGGVPTNTKPSNKKLENVQWADVGAVASRSMGKEDTIAQVRQATPRCL